MVEGKWSLLEILWVHNAVAVAVAAVVVMSVSWEDL